MSRYEQLNTIIAHVKPASIVEVGTWSGDRAIQMATEALKHRKEVSYTGFDLFEEATPETDERELNVKRHYSSAEVWDKLEKFRQDNPGFSFRLVVGDTRETMKDLGCDADLVFLDGGHSLETIRNDYEALKGAKVIVFDDYYEPDEQGNCPDLAKYGCNELLKALPHHILKARDPIKGGGYTRFAVVGVDLPQNTGEKKFKVISKNCVPDESIQENVKNAVSKNFRLVEECQSHSREAVMVSGGASLPDYIEIIREKQKAGGKIVCVKHSHDILIANGIVPWACILLDPRGHVKDFIENPHPDVLYFAASMVHPTTLNRLAEHKAKVWIYHAAVGAGEIGLVKAGFFIGGGTSSASRGIALLEVLGFRRFSLFAYDCCYWSEPNWDEKKEDGQAKYLAVDVNGRRFWTDGERMAEVQDFEKLFKEKRHLSFEAYGSGIVPWIKRQMDKHVRVHFEELFGA